MEHWESGRRWDDNDDGNNEGNDDYYNSITSYL